MGEAKIKQYNRRLFLEKHSLCCYCGDTATTTDHCPPRALFRERNWPIGYEFPACEVCNADGRKYELVAAIVHRLSIAPNPPAPNPELRRLMSGLRNNLPEVAKEWEGTTRNETRTLFRNRFGIQTGDALRAKGYGTIKLGPKTLPMLRLFSRKLAKALYYYHFQAIFKGLMTTGLLDFSRYSIEEELLRITPLYASSKRARVDLGDQLSYRYNLNVEYGAFFAIVKFAGSLGYFILMMSDDFMRESENVEENRETLKKKIQDFEQADFFIPAM